MVNRDSDNRQTDRLPVVAVLVVGAVVCFSIAAVVALAITGRDIETVVFYLTPLIPATVAAIFVAVKAERSQREVTEMRSQVTDVQEKVNGRMGQLISAKTIEEPH